MAAIHLLQASFNGGQLSRRLWFRTDLDIHATACEEMTNALPTVEGAAQKRPGSYFRALALASAARLTPFVFNAAQGYVIEWSEGALRFLTNDALLESGGAPVEVAVPYTAAQAARVSYEQSGDVLYLAHGAHPPAVLARTAADAFAYSPVDLEGGPFGDVNQSATTIAAAGSFAPGGALTLTASTGIFAAGHVGTRMRLEAEDFGAIEAWIEGIDGITVAARRRSEGRVYQAETAGRTGYTQPTHYEGAEWDGDSAGKDVNDNGPFGVRWRYVHDRFGVVRITAVNSATEAVATVERAVPDVIGAAPTTQWAFALFSEIAGWPEFVWLWRGRLWWLRGFDLAGSVSGDYRNHNVYDESGERQADMAIVRRLDITDEIQWVMPDRDAVLIGTSRGEYAIQPVNPAEAISSDNLKVTRQRRHGSAQVWPVEVGGEFMFVQRGGRKVRAASYSFADDRYQARWANLYARHATVAGAKELAFQAEPEEMLWLLRDDGTLAAHAYSPEQEVRGWAKGIESDGAVLSMTAIPSPDTKRDDLWMLANRNGTRTIEQLAPYWDDEAGGSSADSFHLDSGLTYSGAPATQFGGLEHLAGRTIGVLADGREFERTVAGDGTFALDTAASTVHAGLLFTTRIRLLEPEIPQRDGTAMGRLRKTLRATVAVVDAFATMIGLAGRDTRERIVHRPKENATGAPPLAIGWQEPRRLPGGMTRDDRTEVFDRSPYPLTLPAVVREVEIG